MQTQKLTGHYVEARKTRPQPPSKPADMEGTPRPLQPVKQTHRCKICSIVLNPGEPKICTVCTERPEGKALLSMPPNSGKHWTLEEDQQLRTLWEERSLKDIATSLGRSIQSVLNRAHQLKLKAKRPQNRKYYWTAEQDALLKERYNSQSRRIDELARALPMYPRWAIKRRATVLGLARTKEPRWTKKDKTFFAKWLPRRSVEWIARKLNRTVTAVALKSKRSKITKSGAGYTARSLAFGLGVDDHKVAAWIQRGLLRAARRQTRRRGSQNGDYWYIDPADVRDFIKTNPDEVSFRNADKRLLIKILTTHEGPRPNRQSKGNTKGKENREDGSRDAR